MLFNIFVSVFDHLLAENLLLHGFDGAETILVVARGLDDSIVVFIDPIDLLCVGVGDFKVLCSFVTGHSVVFD